jgi:hypothetical protein
MIQGVREQLLINQSGAFLFRNCKVYLGVHRIPSSNPIVSQITSFRIFITNSSNTRFNIILPFMSRAPKWYLPLGYFNQEVCTHFASTLHRLMHILT